MDEMITHLRSERSMRKYAERPMPTQDARKRITAGQTSSAVASESCVFTWPKES